MGYRVADFDLFRRGFINEMKMAMVTLLCGCSFGVVLGDVGKTYKWPNDAMMPEGQSFNLIISIIVSAAAGMVLGVSLTSTGGNALVGTAISAGLLPPLVNAGMMFAYASIYSPIEERQKFYDTSIYNVLFYFTHVVTIVASANCVFWLKDVDPRFKEGEDSDFNDVPTLLDHKLALEGRAMTEKEKAEFFIKNVKEDLKEHAHHAKEKAVQFFNAIGIHALEVGPQGQYVRAGEDGEEYEEDEDGEEEEGEDLEKSRRRRSVGNPIHHSADGEVELVQHYPGPTGSARDQVLSFYREYNPSKPPAEVDVILQRYAGHEEDLLRKLHKQYNVPMPAQS